MKQIRKLFIWCLFIMNINSNVLVNIRKRDETGNEFQEAQSMTFKGLTIHETAKTSQLDYLNLNPMNITEWMQFYNDQLSGSVQNILSRPIFSNLAVVFALGIIIGLMIPLCSVFVCCARRRGHCGRSKLRTTGYSSSESFALYSAYSLSIILVFVFACIGIIYSQGLEGGLGVSTTGAANLLGETGAFADGISKSLGGRNTFIDTSFQRIITEINSLNFTQEFTRLYKPSIDGALLKMKNLDGDFKELNAQLIASNQTVYRLNELITAANISLQILKSDLSALKTLSIDGLPFSVVGFPDTSKIDFLPSTENIPSFQKSINTFNNITNFNLSALRVSKGYNDSVHGIRDKVRSQIALDQLTIPKMLSKFQSMVNLTIGTLASTVEVYEKVVSSQESRVAVGSKGLNAAVTIIFLVLIVALIFGIMAIIFRKPVMMRISLIIIICVSMFVWFEVSIFYLLSAPVNAMCNSLNVVLKSEYTYLEVTVVPSVIVSSCSNYSDIFFAPLNNDGVTGINVLTQFVKGGIYNGSFQFKDGNFTSIPEFGDEVQTTDLAFLEAFSTEEMIIAADIGFNSSALIPRINASLNDLTPSALDANYGSDSSLQTKLTTFNNACKDANSSFVDWDEPYIVNRFIVDQEVFTPSVIVSGNSNNQAIADIQSKWNNLFLNVKFRYYANLEISRAKSNFTLIAGRMANIEKTYIAPIRQAVADLTILSQRIDNCRKSIKLNVDTLKGYQKEVDNAKLLFQKFIDDSLSEILANALEAIISQSIARNSGVGNCKGIVNQLTLTQDGICMTLLNSLSGMWFTAMLVGVFVVATLLLAMNVGKIVKSRGMVEPQSENPKLDENIEID